MSALSHTPRIMAAAALLGLVACSEKPTTTALAPTGDAPVVLAMVAGQPVTGDDLRAEARRLRDAGAPVPRPGALLDALIDRRSAIHRALELGLDQQPEVRRKYENILIANLSQIKPEGTDTPTVTDAEIAAEYQRCRDEFTTPAKRRLAILRLTLPKLASEEKLTALHSRMAEAATAARALPADQRFFGNLADRFSDDPSSRARNGDAGWFDPGRTGYRWPEAIIAAGFELGEQGDVSGVIEIDGDGLYLVKHAGSTPAITQPLEAVHAQLLSRLLRSKNLARQRRLADTNRSAASVEAFPSRLDQVPWDDASPAVAGSDPKQVPPPLPR